MAQVRPRLRNSTHRQASAPCLPSSRRASPGWVALCASAPLWLVLPACTAGPRDDENENDRLRAKVMALGAERDALRTEVAALDQTLEAAEQRGQVNLPEGVRRPVCARIEIGRFSAFAEVDDQPAARIYLRTLDTKGRFVQTVGEVRITIAAAAPGQDAVTLGKAMFTAGELDEAYRSGLAGTHYTLIVPLDRPPTDAPITAAVAMRDLQTGATLHTQAPLIAERP